MDLLNIFRKKSSPLRWCSSDRRFNQLFPGKIGLLFRRHWTRLAVARSASKFLAAQDGSKVLDIGSGIGKFCLVAAIYQPRALFYGIEQRENLIGHADHAKEILNISNVTFIKGNITDINFRDYDHFYFFNSFYEQLEDTDKLDHAIDYSQERYDFYSDYLYKQLTVLPKGTRLATYFARETQIPSSYRLVKSSFEDLLQCWIKD